ncbi:O-antigen ligase family protein [Sphingomonas asaccharolytica]|uniref:O-antigen ligase family protein n=1 Tax=Sphingomonas asaccharolytica TaxID=40681 RepID=UPI000A5748C4|nr:O-antigen ligase family protein [Sphingomonas asaccharolytica]
MTDWVSREDRSGHLRLALVLMADAVFFGGASRLDLLAPLTVRVVAMTIIVWLVWRVPPRDWRIRWGSGLLVTGMLAVPLLQLIPLPWSIWTRLPGHGSLVPVYRYLGETPWRPISITPDRTVNSLAALLPGIAGGMLGLRASSRSAGIVLAAVFGLALVSAAIGLAQVADGSNSSLYFYTITNRDSAVGFFSNANHQSLFLCSAIVITLFLRAEIVAQRPRYATATAIAAIGVVAFLIVSIVATRSRAGISLSALAVLGGFSIGWFGRFPLTKRWVMTGALGGLVAATVVLYLASEALFATPGDLPDVRLQNIPFFWRMIIDYFPFGSGLGSFDPVFRSYETPAVLNFTYLNNAHNDYAQILIETGAFGLVLLVGFFACWVISFVRSWEPLGRRATFGARAPRAASLITLLLLIHSAVDYPLRTAALSTLFAFCFALMTRGSPDRGISTRDPNAEDAAEGDGTERDDTQSAAALVKRLSFRHP